VNDYARRINQRFVGGTMEVLCEGPSRTNPARLMGRTHNNKIVLFGHDDDVVGTFVDVRVERATGFSLYGTPARAHAQTPMAAA
jgi:tRNA-2-methylthio-N6-dimethylallyladenosine synthase